MKTITILKDFQKISQLDTMSIWIGDNFRPRKPKERIDPCSLYLMIWEIIKRARSAVCFQELLARFNKEK